MIILGIESSCDETGIAIIKVQEKKFKVLSNLVNSQIKIHEKTLGVVPEIAARLHVEVINQLLDQALQEARIKMEDIDLIGVTHGPGLVGSLLVGIEVAKTLSWLLSKPLISINHLKAHLHTAYFNINSSKIIEPKYPALGLLVSGGHTELVLMKSRKNWQIIGQTLDDAVGESFDKVAKLIGLGYPGGPIVGKYAEEGDDKKYNLPIPMKHVKNFNFSYSGLKTAVRDLVKSGQVKTEQDKKDLCASFQRVAIEHLLQKTNKAMEKYKIKTLVVAGGGFVQQINCAAGGGRDCCHI